LEGSWVVDWEWLKKFHGGNRFKIIWKQEDLE